MKYSDLHRLVYDELGEGTGAASYDAALLKVLAKLLPSSEPHKTPEFVYLHCPMCGYQDCLRPEKGYCCRKCGESVKPSRLSRIPVMDLGNNQAEIVIQLLICFGMISPLQEGWAKEYYKRDPKAFWNYVKCSAKP